MATEPKSSRETPELRELAARLDCITEGQLQVLGGGLKDSTTEAWRKRKTGPDYIRFGNAFFYPRPGVAKFFEKKIKTGVDTEMAGVL